MVWSLKNAKNDEAAKIRWELVPYMRGFALDIGCGAYKVFPSFTGVDNGHHWGKQQESVHVETAEKLTMFASQSADCVFSSHLLEHIQDYKGALREWWRVLKPGGYLCLYLPHADFYPQCGEEVTRQWREWFKANGRNYAYIELAVNAYVAEFRADAKTLGEKYAGTAWVNEDHKHNFYPQDIINAMDEIGGFDLVQNEDRNEEDEYSFFQVYKKLPSKKERLHSWKEPKGKRAAVVRYGAQGDNIQASSVIPWLKEQGYSVDFWCQTGLGYEVIKNDPHIDRFILQEKDAVPPQFLLEFFNYWKKKYDKWINLCESVEGTLLAVPGRAAWDWPNEARKAMMDRNYLEFIHAVAEVPPPYRPKFYSTPEEKAWARKQAERFGKRNILWSLAGSSGHKVWPHIDDIILRILPSYPDVHITLVGDESCKLLHAGWHRWDEGKDDFVEVNPRVHLRSGKWTIRESMAFAEVADLIIGTETGLLNAAGSMQTPKIVCLSHSSPEMLTKWWEKTIVLQQPEGVGCPKSPCRQLHGVWNSDPWEDCPKHEESGTALCQWNISAESMWVAIQRVLGVAPVLMKRAA